MRFIALFPILWAVILGQASGAPAAVLQSDDLPTRSAPWSDEILEAAASLPIQDGGRVQPLSTLAAFKLLRLNGKRSLDLKKLGTVDKLKARFRMLDPGEVKIGPTAWLLDCMFFPNMTDRYRMFVVEDSALIHELGLSSVGKERFDRYSYEELRPGRLKLDEEMRRVHAIDEKERSKKEGQLIKLASNVREYETLKDALFFATRRYRVPAEGALHELFAGAEEVSYSQILARTPELQGLQAELRRIAADDHSRDQERAQLRGLKEWLIDAARFSLIIDLFPPSDREDLEWRSPGELVFDRERSESFQNVLSMRNQGGSQFARELDELLESLPPAALSDDELACLQAYEGLWEKRENPEAFEAAFLGLHEQIRTMAEARGEYGKIPMEVSYYKADWLFWSLFVFVLSFLLVAFTWLFPRSKMLHKAALGSTLLALGLLVTGIVIRCILRDRPPVSTLYETILFITACGVLVALCIEWMSRMRIGLAVAVVIGVAGMFLAMKNEIAGGRDTLQPLVAVLDTNFWLATHVTCVTLGYAAGLLAGILAMIHVLGRALGLRRDDRAFYREVTRMVYGVLCFGVLLSTVGTILGGIWANDSWGRFWGWDPKENGALMIILWELAVLHARMGGYIRAHGMCMALVFGNIVVSFSWWHVNLLGVGLHSYGFEPGKKRALFIWYGLNLLILAIGFVSSLLRKDPRTPPPPPEQAVAS